MSRVQVNPNILNWAITRSGKTRDILEKKFPKIHDWFKGTSYPTLKQIENLAKSTYTPLGYFFLEKPPKDELPIPYLRTDARKDIEYPSPDFIDTFYMMQRRQQWMREYSIEDGELPLDFVGSLKTRRNADTIALKMREALDFSSNWASHFPNWSKALDHLRLSMENIGIIVVINGCVGNNTHRVLDINEFKGFALVDEYSPLVFVNGSDYKVSQMFTLAHELAHIFIGKSAAFDLRRMQPANDPVEVLCNKAAAEFLVPEDLLESKFKEYIDQDNKFDHLARYFKVSSLVIARRCMDIELISSDEFFDYYDFLISKLNKDKFGKKDVGGDFYNNQNMRIGKRFASKIIRAAQEGRLLYSQAYQLTGLYGRKFDEYMLRINR